MSKLIDRLHQLTQSAPQAMGFRTSQAVSTKYRIQLVAHLTSADTDRLADLAAADAVIVPITGSEAGKETQQHIQQFIPHIPCGIWLTKPQTKAKAVASQIDIDFVIFAPGRTLTAVPDNEATGKILEVPPSLDEGLLSAIDQLPVDAVLITGAEPAAAAVTWHNLMVYQRFASILSKPLLVEVPPGVSAAELQVLWKAGIAAVVVAIDTAKSAVQLKQLRQEIEQLEFPAPYQQNNIAVLLPRSRVTEGELGDESDD